MKVLMIGNDSTVKGGITSVIDQFRTRDWAKDGITIDYLATYKYTDNVRKILFFFQTII